MITVHLYMQNGGNYDITQTIDGITWSGDYQQASRKLELDVLYPSTDTNQEYKVPSIGDGIFFYEDGKELFRGIVWDITLDTTSQFATVSCYDAAIYLSKNEVAKPYVNITAEAAARSLCNEFSIPVGSLAYTGISRNYLALQIAAYDVIMGLYTFASKSNGKKYVIRVDNGLLNVLVKGDKQVNTILDPSFNVESAQHSESLDGMVNKVVVYDDKGNTKLTKENTGWQQLYGMLQKAIQFDEKADNADVANKALNDTDKKSEVKALGDNEAITGNKIYIRVPHTKMVGVFYIDGDNHTWKQNVHMMNLTLNFENIMDEKDIQDSSN